MTETDILSRLRTFVTDTFLYMRPGVTIVDDQPLLAAGVIDSLGVMELVGFVEQTFGVSVAPDDITEQNFGTLRGIARYVLARSR